MLKIWGSFLIRTMIGTKVFVYICFSTAVISFASGQSISDFDQKRDSLIVLQKAIALQIDSLESCRSLIQVQIEFINAQQKRIELDHALSQGYPTKVRLKTHLMDGPVLGEILQTIPEGDTVLVLDWFERPYFKVLYQGQFGYVSYMYLVKNNITSSIIDNYNQEHPKVSPLTKKYGFEIASRIKQKQIWIGMTDDMAKESIGKPTSVNRTVSVWGVQEQWIYRGRHLYLYFDDGVLTSYQDEP